MPGTWGNRLSDIFLSYNREDSDTARRFAEGLEREGFSVWWDQTLRSGEAYDEVTEAALKSAKAVVVLWSPRSVVSRWVRAEATIADRNKTLVPVMIEPCERPIMFELTQTAELGHWRGEANDKAWLALVGDVQRFVGREIAAPIASLPPEPAPPSPGERGGAPSLAVLPFTNRSGLPEDEVFAIGMVEDVIDALSQGVNVRVLSSSATARFAAGATPDVAALGQQLGVRYLLEGNVRRVGESLRVTAQLVEAAGGEILWTQKFDQPLAELAALQETLVREVAANLGTNVYRLEMARALRKPSDLTAWECCTRAMSAYRQYNSEVLQTVVTEAQRAITIAPDYALGHAVLAGGLVLQKYDFGISDFNPQMRWHIDRALALDPENAAVLGWICGALTYFGLPQEGLRHGIRAIQLSPGFSFAHFGCAVASSHLNRIDEALAYLVNFRRLEPGSHLEYLALGWEGLAHARNGDWRTAEQSIDRGLALAPEVAFLWYEKAIYAGQQGRSTAAHEAMIKVRQLEPAVTLAFWEVRFGRWLVNSPNLDEVLARVRALWEETEGSA